MNGFQKWISREQPIDPNNEKTGVKTLLQELNEFQCRKARNSTRFRTRDGSLCKNDNDYNEPFLLNYSLISKFY